GRRAEFSGQRRRERRVRRDRLGRVHSPRQDRPMSTLLRGLALPLLALLWAAVPPEDPESSQKLAKVLQEPRTVVKVSKAGDEAEKGAYIVGKTTGGKWAGLKTTVVET